MIIEAETVNEEYYPDISVETEELDEGCFMQLEQDGIGGDDLDIIIFTYEQAYQLYEELNRIFNG